MTNTRTREKIRAFLTTVYIVYTLFIFSNSLQNAAESSGRSLAVLDMIDRIIGSGILTEHMVRKAAHFCEFALLGVLGIGTWRMYGFGVIHAAFAGLLTAVTDETLQIFSAGRSSQLTDVWIDFSGCLTGILLMSVLIKAFNKNHDI